MKKIFTLLAVAAFPALSFAQSQRLVLIEHFSNASCGPCAAANPAFNARVAANADKVVAIKYQWDFPGFDPMNQHNPTEVDNRIALYGINGVPNTVIDGNFFNDHPNLATQAKFDQRAAVTSPFTVNVSQSFSQMGDSVYVTAVVTKTGTVDPNANLKLHMVVIEKEIRFPVAPGSNGEKYFPSVMKKMLPNPTGTSLPVMNIGDTHTVKLGWKMANVYDVGQIASVAFVQNTVNKEVMQAGFASPNFPVQMALNAVSGKKARVAGENSTGYFNIMFKTNSANADTYRLRLNKSQLPSGWNAEFVVGGQTYSDEAMVNMAAATDSQNVEIKIYTGNQPNQKGTVTLESNSTTSFTGYVVSGTATAFTTIRTAWINKASNNNTFLNSFTAAGTTTLQLTADEFASMDPEGFTSDRIDHIFLNTGGEYSATLLSDREIANLTSYLSTNGNLFISGQDIGYSAFPAGGSSAFKSFYQTYLGASYLHDGDDDGVSIAATATDPVFGSLANTNLSTGSFELYSDIIAVNTTRPNASAIINYTNLAVNGYSGTTGVAGVRNHDGWKVVYTSFRPEAIADANFRNVLMGKAIEWFDGMLVGTEFDEEIAKALNIFPNPATSEFTVTLGNTKATAINVVDMLGRVVISQNVSANETSPKINTSRLNAGTYFVQVKGGAKVATQKLVIVK